MISQSSMFMVYSNLVWEATRSFQYQTSKLFIIFKTLKELRSMKSAMSSTSTMLYRQRKVSYSKSRVLSLTKLTQSVRSLLSFTRSRSTKNKLVASSVARTSISPLEKSMSALSIIIKVKKTPLRRQPQLSQGWSTTSHPATTGQIQHPHKLKTLRTKG